MVRTLVTLVVWWDTSFHSNSHKHSIIIIIILILIRIETHHTALLINKLDWSSLSVVRNTVPHLDGDGGDDHYVDVELIN